MPQPQASFSTHEISFGRCVIQSAARRLLIDGQPAKLGARAFDVLMALVEQGDAVVSKNELLDVVWPGLVVEENNLQVHISTLRKLLGAQSILTIPGKGYQFSALRTDVPGAALASPEVVSASTSIGNLPHDLPPLLGRETELAALASMLPLYRLITITGAGGMGKTRLAQAAAFAATRDRTVFPDGVWLIEFAPVSDWQGVLASIAQTLGIALDADATIEQLAARVAERKTLIVFDNCEHVAVHVTAAATALLRTAPSVRLLTTSQELLKLPDERVMRLGALAYPQGVLADTQGVLADPFRSLEIAPKHEQEIAVDDTTYGAVLLFVARAREAAPKFELNRHNRSTVVEICRRLDGIPLAIEFAAARLPLLGIEGLRRRLDDRFRLLVSGTRLAPQRQQTLYAALEWSHALLAPAEQIVFRRLAVFKGSFGLDVAQTVGTDGDYDEWAVLDHLSALIDKSFVISESGATPRYRLLESARVFALERLQQADELHSTTARLAETVLKQFETAFADRWTANTSVLLASTLPDIDNLRAALFWAAGDADNGTQLAALVGASGWFWKPANLAAEGLRWFRTAMQHISADTPADVEARLLLGYAIALHQSAADKELSALHRAAMLYRSLNDNSGLYETLCVLAQKQIWQHDLAAADKTIDEASAAVDPTWPPVMREGLLTARTYWLEVSGRPAEGEPLMVELVTLMRALGDDRKLDHALMQMAESLFVQGKTGQAISLRREVMQRIGERRVNYAASNLGNLCAALTFNDELDEALRVGRAAFPLAQYEGSLNMFADHFALLACKLGHHAEAARLAGRANANVSTSGFEREESELRAARMTEALLLQAMPSIELDAFKSEGAALTNEAAIRAALGIDRRSAERAAIALLTPSAPSAQ